MEGNRTLEKLGMKSSGVNGNIVKRSRRKGRKPILREDTLLGALFMSI